MRVGSSRHTGRTAPVGGRQGTCGADRFHLVRLVPLRRPNESRGVCAEPHPAKACRLSALERPSRCVARGRPERAYPVHIEWILDALMQRPTQVGLNKGRSAPPTHAASAKRSRSYPQSIPRSPITMDDPGCNRTLGVGTECRNQSTSGPGKCAHPKHLNAW